MWKTSSNFEVGLWARLFSFRPLQMERQERYVQMS